MIVHSKEGIIIKELSDKTHRMLNYAQQLSWLNLLYSNKDISADEYIKIKKVLQIKFQVKQEE